MDGLVLATTAHITDGGDQQVIAMATITVTIVAITTVIIAVTIRVIAMATAPATMLVSAIRRGAAMYMLNDNPVLKRRQQSIKKLARQDQVTVATTFTRTAEVMFIKIAAMVILSEERTVLGIAPRTNPRRAIAHRNDQTLNRALVQTISCRALALRPNPRQGQHRVRVQLRRQGRRHSRAEGALIMTSNAIVVRANKVHRERIPTVNLEDTIDHPEVHLDRREERLVLLVA